LEEERRQQDMELESHRFDFKEKERSGIVVRRKDRRKRRNRREFIPVLPLAAHFHSASLFWMSSFLSSSLIVRDALNF
jgi:hypothetical protein